MMVCGSTSSSSSCWRDEADRHRDNRERLGFIVDELGLGEENEADGAVSGLSGWLATQHVCTYLMDLDLPVELSSSA